ncbi:At5g01610-like protein [Dioscorea alata]|uniref:At5g01610-like protein n=1 Tax=Dioscorea alata TaxID=55571 RepID=A0ACB7TUI7_DIOAL|nr:At5g01610-like protein [Dioscorea alata]
MASQTINGVETCKGDALCKMKSIQLLEEIGLPNGLFPSEDIEEFGSCFIWLIQKKKDHTFKKMKRVVSYAPEVTAFVEKGKMKKMTGVKTKELMVWLSVVEMYIDEPSSKKITFKPALGFQIAS